MNSIQISDNLQDEMTQFEAYLAAKAGITAKLTEVLRTLFEKHRQNFVAETAAYYLATPAEFLEKRQPNETVTAYFRRKIGWPKEDDHSKDAEKLRDRVEMSVGFTQPGVLWLTTHPDIGNHKANPPFWKDREGRDAWVKNDDRKAFKVKMLDNAQALAVKQAEADANAVLAYFTHRTLRKLDAILTKSPQYFAGLIRGQFLPGVIEGDIRITFVDMKSFVIHVALKTNYTAERKPYIQYPLLFQDVYAGTGTTPVKAASQEEVEKIFGVEPKDRWEPTEKKKVFEFSSPKTGDVVKVKGKKPLGQYLGKARKAKGFVSVELFGGEAVNVDPNKIEKITHRLDVDFETVKEGKKERKVFYFTVSEAGGTEAEKVYFPVKLNGKCEESINNPNAKKDGWKNLGRKLAFGILGSKGVLGKKPELAVA